VNPLEVSETESAAERVGTPGQPGNKMKSELLEWVKSITLALGIVLVIHLFVFNLSTVKGQSMEPTLEDGEWLFINKLGYWFGQPKRGDIVILKDPDGQLGLRQYLVKRIVGIPGDMIEISNEQLFVNGKPLIEPYTNIEIQDGNYGPEKVLPGHYFVMGDNRHQWASTDSRTFHAVPEKLIKGKAQFVLWPFASLGGLYDKMPEETK